MDNTDLYSAGAWDAKWRQGWRQNLGVNRVISHPSDWPRGMRRRHRGRFVCRRDRCGARAGPVRENPREQGMELGGNLGHLVYSTLVHPGDTWDEMWASLNRYLPEVKARFSPDKPFGVSIRNLAELCRQADVRRARAGAPQGIPGRQRFVSDHRKRLSLWTVQRRAGQGEGLRAGLADGRPRPIHRHGRRHPGRNGAPRHRARPFKVRRWASSRA